MRSKPAVDREVFVAAAAKLRSVGTPQRNIAEQLDVSQGEVSRLLEDARRTGWLAENPEFKKADDAVWNLAEQYFFSAARTLDRLRATFERTDGGKLLNRATLIDVLPGGSIAPASARIVAALLGQAHLVGVTWGNTLSGLVDALGKLVEAPRRRGATHQVQFVPLCGEPLRDPGDPSNHSSSVLALRLTSAFNPGYRADRTTPSIAGVQAFIPLEFRKGAEVETIRRFISRVRGYTHVFGAADQQAANGPPLANRLDAILTSVGTVEGRHRGIFLNERIASGDISELDLERTSVGDVGGVIIPAAGISRAEEDRIKAMNDRWTGVRLEHLRHCAETAMTAGFTPEKPGVLMLAVGARRRKIMLRCIELGLVNELIIDRELDHALAA